MARVDKYVSVNSNGGLSHKNAGCRLHFDTTSFGSKSNFEKFLERFNLKSGYKRYSHTVKFSVVEDKRYYDYVWANSNVAIKTRNNPITGKYTRPSERRDEKGHASSMTIEGRCDKVKEMREWLENNRSVRIKGRKHKKIRKPI